MTQKSTYTERKSGGLVFSLLGCRCVWSYIFSLSFSEQEWVFFVLVCWEYIICLLFYKGLKEENSLNPWRNSGVLKTIKISKSIENFWILQYVYWILKYSHEPTRTREGNVTPWMINVPPQHRAFECLSLVVAAVAATLKYDTGSCFECLQLHQSSCLFSLLHGCYWRWDLSVSCSTAMSLQASWSLPLKLQAKQTLSSLGCFWPWNLITFCNTKENTFCSLVFLRFLISYLIIMGCQTLR